MSKSGIQNFVTDLQEVTVRKRNATNLFVKYKQKSSVKKTKKMEASSVCVKNWGQGA